jgi:hypothetical protein
MRNAELANPRRDYRFYLHRDHFVRYVDLASSTGLEIGAFDLPMVESNEGRCEFADFRTVDELKTLASTQDGHSVKYVANVQYDLRKGYDGIKKKYQWIVASHVIEHIPDVIGWLSIIHSKLDSGGVLFLVIPDKNYTYDFHRSETNLSNCVGPHRNRLMQPSFEQVFDHHYFTFNNIDPGVFWRGGPIPGPIKIFQQAYAIAERSLSEFVDAHCSVFTPVSFVSLINDMIDASLIKFKLEEVRSTQYNQLDFSTVLRAIDRTPEHSRFRLAAPRADAVAEHQILGSPSIGRCSARR